MKDELFQGLLASVKQGGAIVEGALPPSRTFEFPETDALLDIAGQQPTRKRSQTTRATGTTKRAAG